MQTLVMELVEGEDLSQRTDHGPIPLDEVLPIAKQIAEALGAAHEQGIIHRDLKPANIKVRPDGTVKLLDLNISIINYVLTDIRYRHYCNSINQVDLQWIAVFPRPWLQPGPSCGR
jgi:serine/threonine protein kinase